MCCDRTHLAQEAKVVDFEKERGPRKWRAGTEQIGAAHAEMMASATPEDAAVALFRLARKHRDLRIGPGRRSGREQFRSDVFLRHSAG